MKWRLGSMLVVSLIPSKLFGAQVTPAGKPSYVAPDVVERRLVKTDWLLAAEHVANRVKDTEAIRIAQALRQDSVLVKPEKREYIPLEFRLDARFLLTVILDKDLPKSRLLHVVRSGGCLFVPLPVKAFASDRTTVTARLVLIKNFPAREKLKGLLLLAQGFSALNYDEGADWEKIMTIAHAEWKESQFARNLLKKLGGSEIERFIRAQVEEIVALSQEKRGKLLAAESQITRGLTHREALSKIWGTFLSEQEFNLFWFELWKVIIFDYYDRVNDADSARLEQTKYLLRIYQHKP